METLINETETTTNIIIIFAYVLGMLCTYAFMLVFKRTKSKYKRDSKINRVFYGFFFKYVPDEIRMVNTVDSFMITDLSSYISKRTLHLKIVTHRPGLIIGKGGKHIDSIKEHMISELEDEIDNCVINLKECTLWHFKKY